MADRNTRIRKGQVGDASVEPIDLDNDNEGNTGNVPSIGEEGQFHWVIPYDESKEGFNEGVLSNATIIDASGLNINVSSVDVLIRSDINFPNYLYKFTVPQADVEITDNSLNYIYVDYNGGSPIYKATINRDDINNSNHIPVARVYITEGNIEYQLNYGFMARSSTIRNFDRVMRTRGNAGEEKESGLALSETATRIINITSGYVWLGNNRISLDAIVQNETGVTSHIYHYATGGVWEKEDITQYDNLHYDDGTGLVELLPNRYAVNWVFRNLVTDEIDIVLGTGDYTEAQANASQIPALPPEIVNFYILVGRIIVKKSEDTAYAIEVTNHYTFQGAIITIHNDLSGLNEGDYVHLTSAEKLDTDDAISKKHSQNTDTGTNQNNFNIGDGVDTDKEITANNADANKPKLRYNSLTNKWQYSNNGVDFLDIGSSSGAETLEDLTDVEFPTGTPTDGQVLTFDEGSNKWKPEDPTGAVDSVNGQTGEVNLTADDIPTEDSGVTTQEALNALEVDQHASHSDDQDASEVPTDESGVSVQDKLDEIPTVDNFTIINTANVIKVADRIEQNIMLLAFYRCVDQSKSVFNLIDGIIDEYEDETGIDTDTSTNESYNAEGKYYSPSSNSNSEIDYMEYASDALAKLAYVSSDGSVSGGNDDYAKLMMHNDGQDGGKEIVDDGDTGHIVTQVGTATLSTAQKKFGYTSLLLDGDSDYLTVPDSDDWDIWTAQCSIDFWIRFNSVSTEQGIIAQYLDATNYWLIAWNSSDGLYFKCNIGGNKGEFHSNWLSPSINTWYHLAIIRNGSNCLMFVNGTALSVSETVAFGAITNISTVLKIGYSGVNYLNGYLDELRISKGIARWTENFSVPTEEYTADAHTKLLLHMNSLDVCSSTKIPTFVGTAQLDSMNQAVRKIGNGSLLLDGDSDYITAPDSADWTFGTGNFTIDFWINFNAVGSDVTLWTIHTGGNHPSVYLRFNGTVPNLEFRAYDGGFLINFTFPFSPSAGIWYHIAIVRSGTSVGTWFGFINGVSQILNKDAGDWDCSLPDCTNMWIGVHRDTSGYVNGYFDEFRISKGLARWTANFTPQITEYTSDANTQLLCHFDNRIIDSGNTGHTLTAVGTAQITAQHISGNGGWRFDGSDDYISYPDSDDFDFGSGDFTIDFWLNMPSSDGHEAILWHYQNDDNYWGVYINKNYATYNCSFYAIVGGVAKADYHVDGASTFNFNTWYHVAMVRNGTNFYIFINGVVQSPTIGTAIGSNDLSSNTGTLYIGQRGSSAYYYTGYIDELRVSKGIARWTSGFTPSISQYTTDEYTKLLLHLDYSASDSSGNAHVPTYVSNTYGATANARFGSASIKLDGDSDSITAPHSADWTFGTDPFTIDCWVKFASFNAGTVDCFLYQGTDASNWWMFSYVNDNHYLTFGNIVADSYNIQFRCTYTFAINTWYHIAVVRISNTDETTHKMFINGVSQSLTLANGAWTASLNDWAGALSIGARNYGSALYFNGYIDELRVSKGIARWTTDFTPETSEYTEAIDGNLDDYSEDTIKTQGTYSLKGIAKITESLNDTLTKTLDTGSHLDLSGYNTLKFDIRSSRTGQNLQLQLHDSGGTTSTYDIDIESGEEDTFVTKSWDISEIADANKDDIDSIIIKVTNADAENTFYIDNFYAEGTAQDMTLVSEEFTAEAEPANARIVVFEEDVDAITINTDLKCWISIDDGANYDQITLVDEGDWETGKRILSGIVNVSAQTGTTIRYKITSHNAKSCKIHGTAVSWT